MQKRKSSQAEAPYRKSAKSDGYRGRSSQGLRKSSKKDIFLSADKSKVIELLMQNDQVLLYLYEKLFPITSTQSNTVSKTGLAASHVSFDS